MNTSCDSYINSTCDTSLISTPSEIGRASSILNCSQFPYEDIQNEPIASTSFHNMNVDVGPSYLSLTTKTSEPNRKSISKKSRRSKRRPYKISIENSGGLLKSYDCELCDEKFHLPSLLRMHREKNHILLKPYRCYKCPEQFNIEQNFQIHTSSHIRAPTTCPVCGLSFQRSAGYRGHLKTHMIPDNFRCKRCERDFEFEAYYRRHIETRHGKLEESDEVIPRRVRSSNESHMFRKYSCDICSARFTKASNLQRHKLVHSKTKPFRCVTCPMEFTQKSSLQRHSLLHTGDKGYKCSKCAMRFTQRGNLQTHMSRVHPHNLDLTNKFPCPNCSCVFNKLNSLNRHSAKMHSVKLSNLDEANSEDVDFNKVMAQLKTLQSNMNSILDSPSDNCSLFPNGNSTIPLIGSISTQEVTDDNEEYGYVKIVETQNAEQEKSEVVVKQVEGNDGRLYYGCSICMKQFSKPYDLVRHNRVHTNEKLFECGICGCSFAVKSNLQAHLRIHGKNAGRITNCHQCPACFMQFSSLRQLDIHAKDHKDSKLFLCKVCQRLFASNHNLRVHQRTHRSQNEDQVEIRRNLQKPILENNSGEIPATKAKENKAHQCSLCGLTFKRSTHLTQHEKTHSGAKLFQCITCNKCLTTRSSLKIHQKIHSGHKALQCSHCNAKFRSNADLKRHEAVHSILRPYLCPYCEKSFKTKGTCHAHILTHIKDLKGIQPNKEKIPIPVASTSTPLEYEFALISDDHFADVNLEPNLLQSDNLIYNIDTSFEHTVRAMEILDDFPPTDSNPQPSLPNSSKFIEIDELLYSSPTKSLANSITVNAVANSTNSFQTFAAAQASESGQCCEICGRVFKKPIDLRRHLRTHTKEKPFKCDICNASFALKCTMETHKLVHDDKRAKFECQVCGRSYASQNILKVHLRIHTNERPYKCDYCGKTFRTTGHRSSHMRIHIKLPKTGNKRNNKKYRKMLMKKTQRVEE